MKIKKIVVAMLAIALVAVSFTCSKFTASAAQATAIAFNEDNVNLVVKPGEINHIKLPIKAIGSTILLPEVTMIDKSEGSIFTFTKPTLKTNGDIIASSIAQYGTTYVEFDVTVKETAQIGSYTAALDIIGQGEYDGTLTPYTISFEFKLQVLEEKAPIQLTIGDVFYKTLVPGSNSDLSFKVKNEGEVTARNIYINLDYKDSGIQANYSTKKVKAGDLLPGAEKYFTLPISALPTAIAGKKTVTVNFDYKNLDGESKQDTYSIDITIKENDKAPVIEIDSISYGDVLRPGDEFVLVTNLVNSGDTDAQNVSISIDAGIGSSFIKDYFSDGIWVPNIKKDSKRKAEIPLIVSQSTTGGLQELKIIISYTDGEEVPYIVTKTVYLDVTGTGDANIIISDVKQTPAQPVAGEKVEVSFYCENKSAADITELRISTDTLASNNFIPVDSEPYQYIEKLASGTKMRITIPLIVSDTVPEGVNILDIKYSYAGSDGEKKESILIRDVINDLVSSSKPILIVSDYSADVAELRAGSIFNFTYDLYNTNTSVAAKNITVTITQEENVFAPTKGSNSFYISRINAGETVSNTIELKVKSDASTKVYPLKITIEYEYDGMKVNPDTNESGEIQPIVLNLQAVENSRPVIDYVNVYSWDGMVKVSNPAMLSFEFYNMGKSPLNNVIATVEGDFTSSAGSMYFIGNVPEGSSAYAEFEVIPNVEGIAKGVVKITFEDSNGEEVAFTKEFETTVMGAQVFDPGTVDGGVDVFNPTVPVAKKSIVPIWLFIIIQVIIFALFIPVTRKIIISIYKAKLRKKEEEKY